LMRSAQESALEENFAIAVKRIDEALKIIRQLVKEGELELNVFVGRSLLFRAAVIRFYQGPEACVNAFNEAIRHFVDLGAVDDLAVQNELALALMSKADILMDPLGAYAAALADQEQAAKIWRHLLHRGNPEFRQPLITALMACSDSKIQNGDRENALRDLKDAAEIAEEGVEAGELAIQHLCIQTLHRLARLYEQNGDIEKAFETIRSAIRIVKKLIAGGIDQARMMFTTLYLHLGMMYEKIHDSASALNEFDRCRDVFVEMSRDAKWGEAESYIFRTGLANVQMCRGNMLADLKRYEEAEAAFEESVWQYQQAAEQKPPDDQDDTLIPYSIGVVQLNHANMLVVQDKYDEAVALKEQALVTLRRRMEAGHDEIIPNFLVAYRKLISIRQFQENTEQVLELMNNLIGILEGFVDDGKLEHRVDLALSYRQRSIQRDEIQDFENALKDAIRALQIFRMVADDDRDIPDVHISKIQWSELLHQIAVLYVKHDKSDEAFEFLHREIADAVRFYEEGNEFAAVDLLLAYTQYFNFAETFGNHIVELKYPPEKFALRVQTIQTYCRNGVELSQKKRDEKPKDLSARLFFMMKTAFFYKADGMLYRLLKENEPACGSFEKSIEHWYLLLEGLEKLKAKDRYDAAEKGEPVPDWDIPGGADDPYQDRYVYYMNELRETMQLNAKALLACRRIQESKKLFEKENSLTRELVQNGVQNADRFLIISLTSHARNLVEEYPLAKMKTLYEEALQVLKKRFDSGDIVAEDFWVLKRICKDYLDFLRGKELFGDAYCISEGASEILGRVQTFPPPDLWMETCMVLEMHVVDSNLPEEILDICRRHRKLLKRHPEFKSHKNLKRYDRALKIRVDKIKGIIAEPD